jgi:hypothetical protein
VTITGWASAGWQMPSPEWVQLTTTALKASRAPGAEVVADVAATAAALARVFAAVVVSAVGAAVLAAVCSRHWPSAEPTSGALDLASAGVSGAPGPVSSAIFPVAADISGPAWHSRCLARRDDRYEEGR